MPVLIPDNRSIGSILVAPVWFGEHVVAGESQGFESGLLLIDQRLQTGTLRGDADFCGHGRLPHSNRHRLVQSRL